MYSYVCIYVENIYEFLLIYGMHMHLAILDRLLIDTRSPIYFFRHHSRLLLDLKSLCDISN